jgi:hypothetical protein
MKTLHPTWLNEEDKMDKSGIEPPTTTLSTTCSNQLSYKSKVLKMQKKNQTEGNSLKKKKKRALKIQKKEL